MTKLRHWFAASVIMNTACIFAVWTPAATAPPVPPSIYHVDVRPHPPLDCDFVPPVCDGGLLPQTSDAGALNDYAAKYDTAACRYVEPPRCPINYTPQCDQECTP